MKNVCITTDSHKCTPDNPNSDLQENVSSTIRRKIKKPQETSNKKSVLKMSNHAEGSGDRS